MEDDVLAHQKKESDIIGCSSLLLHGLHRSIALRLPELFHLRISSYLRDKFKKMTIESN